MAKKILKISCYVALGIFFIANVIWELRVTAAIGNIYVLVKTLEQRVDILSSGNRKNDGTIPDKTP